MRGEPFLHLGRLRIAGKVLPLVGIIIVIVQFLITVRIAEVTPSLRTHRIVTAMV